MIIVNPTFTHLPSYHSVITTSSNVVAMSTAKRSRRRQTEEVRSPSPLPASKRLKTTPTPHVPTPSGLGFLVDEDARTGRKLDARLTNGVFSGKTHRVNEADAVVAPSTRFAEATEQAAEKPREIIDISSAEEASSEEEEEEEEPNLQDGNVGEKVLVNGHVGDFRDERLEGIDAYQSGEEGGSNLGAADERTQDVVMHQTDSNVETGDPEEPSFGDMLQARHPEPIDVQASFADPMAERSALLRVPRSQALVAPSAGSLTTVLTQALRTNDRDLLESCFQVTDLSSIRSTIQRLQPQLVSSLLQRLAERIYKRPGRTGTLMVWVQWSMVAHGGYLATQPDIMRKLKSLAQVAHERAQGLQPLLHLKGKLDMLHAQLELRRGVQAASRAAHAEDEDDEEGVTYIEGRDDEWSEDDDVAMEDLADRKLLEPPARKSKGPTAAHLFDMAQSDDDEESDDDQPNGVSRALNDASSEDEDEAEEDGEGMFDIEAEETSDDDDDNEEASSSADDESAPESEGETDPSDDESEPDIKPPQPKTLNRRR